MEIIINNNYKLFEIQKEFSKHFPFLKLEFFKFEKGREKVFSKENIIADTNKTVKSIHNLHDKGHISINGHQKVSTLEQHFREYFGIDVQVFRKSGTSWLETTTTDNWTLSEQNKKGEEMSNTIQDQNTDLYNQYHEQDY